MSNPLHDRLAYLLKHAREGLAAQTGPALEPYNIDGRSLAVLTVLSTGRTPLSQQEAAAQLSVDRTSMVALIDGLEAKGLVARAPHPADRRKNVVTLTRAGYDTLMRAGEASRQAEHAFLERLSDAEADQLRDLLRRLL